MSDTSRVPDAVSSSLVDIAHWRAEHQTDRLAYTFLVDGETTESTLTYGELDRKARQIAAILQQHQLAGERALLLYPPGLDYITAFFGCLYAGVVAVPAYPPNPARLSRSLTRLRALVDDAAPAVVLTTATHLPIDEVLRAQVPDFPRMTWLATESDATDRADDWRNPGATRDTLAFLQYTSGSTALPKGVMLSHGNLLHNSTLIHHAFGHTPESRGVIWLPPYHDMGLIGGVIQPLYAGFPVTLMSPVDFLQRPLRWLQAISRYRGTTSGGPNFAYELCVNKVTPEQIATLDLSSWDLAFNGAEPIRPETLDRFATAFAPCGFRHAAFYPCYGLAEATLIVAGGAKAAPPHVMSFDRTELGSGHVIETTAEHSQPFVGSGQSLLEQQIAIVDPQSMTRCQPDQVGEIWVAGLSVAHGYWNRPETTEQTFRARIAGTDEGPFLRTGDLGFIQGGELFVTGRLKDLIIVRGRNYYPQDIELTVERSHPALRPGAGAAFGIEVGGEEQIVVVHEIDRQHRRVEIESVVGAIRQAVAEQHELRVYSIALIKHGSIPKTSSGKIQRHACRNQFLSGDLQLIGSSTLEAASLEQNDETLSGEEILALVADERLARIEAYLQAQVAQVLRSAERPRLDAAIGGLGLDSLMAVDLQYRLESSLGVLVPMAQFFEDTTLSRLAAQILSDITDAPGSLATLQESAQPGDKYALSPGQQAIWFLHQLAPESAAYNIGSAARVQGDLHVAALRRAFQAVVDRHPALRTTFGLRDGNPVQSVQPSVSADFVVEDASSWDAAALDDRLTAEAHRPFNLEHGPLLRVRIFKRSEREHALLLVVHHIVSDLWSLATIVHEIGQLYPAELDGRSLDLAPLSLRYADYVAWQRDLLAGPEGERLWSYWQQLRDVSTALDLPADHPRPSVQTFTGAAHTFQLGPELTRELKALTQATETTPFMALLAAFQVLLYRYSGQESFLVGSPTSGRSRARLADSVGYFVNPVALRADLAGRPTFSELLGRVRRTVQGALSHQDYPFPLLVERLQPERDPSRSPLFQTMFVLQQGHIAGQEQLAGFALGDSGAQLQIDGLQLTALELEQQVAQFDITLMMAELDDDLVGSLQYNSDLFEPATMARLADHFQQLLQAIVADPHQRVTALPLLTIEERQQLLSWNQSALAVPDVGSIPQAFEAQAARTPAATALIVGTQRLTYHELNQRANQLAHALRERGIGPEVRVGVCLHRTADLVVALLAVLKAGGAYVPLDPAYPQERLRFMLTDAQAPLLLTQSSLTERVPTHDAAVLCLDTDWQSIASQPTHNPPWSNHALNLAYLIYTSGSTGRPKGVAITHHSAAVLLGWAQQAYTPEQLAGVLAATSVCFDLSVFELFVPLSAGGTVILADTALDLPTLPAAQHVTLLNTVPSAAAELLRLDGLPPSVQTVNLAGEPLPQALAHDLYAHGTVAQVINLYGPSEDTTYSTWAVIPQPVTETPTIGRPIAHTQAYVLDADMQPVPLGVVGELYLGGDGLARGYLHRPDLTAERFVPDAFGAAGARLYRTGDRVRYRADGQLDFLGRLDHQVKVRGFRIELGEIEQALRRHAAIAAAVAIVRAEVPGDPRIVAYVVANTETTEQPNTGDTSDGARCSVLGASDLRRFLDATLPPYMVPSAFV
ncbi:MAG TPA: amino acid adenylation domain-containing protein, partial [Herpetosiphonaceae bacterium]